MRIRISIAAAFAAAALTSVLAGTAFAAPPANDNFSNRQDLGSALPASVTGTTVEATAETGEPDHTAEGDGAGASIWYQWIAPASQRITFDTCFGNFPILRVYTGLSLGALSPVGGDGSCRAIVDVAGGVTYKIALDGRFGEDVTSLLIRAVAVPANDDLVSASTLGSGTSFSAGGTTVDATREAGETDPSGRGGSVWYMWRPAGSGRATLDTCTSTGDPALSVYTGNAVQSLTLVAHDDDGNDPACAPNNRGSRLSFSAAAGTTYRIAVVALRLGAEGSFTLAGSQVLDPNPPADSPATKKCKKGKKLKQGKCVKKKRKKKKKKKK